ncbi:MAG TPA: nucleoside phosphorylase [Syntrophobacteria bacterium]|nr:nucleoside phosphorylase [Syntrophobacteria bacterium]
MLRDSLSPLFFCLPMTDDRDRVIIEPRRGLRERPSAPSAIIAGAEADRRRLCRRAARVAGSARQFYNARFVEVVAGDRVVTVAGPVLGSPQAVLVLERLIALGSRTIAMLGWCGSLQPQVRIGDWILPTAARSEEGTSVHYPSASVILGPDPTLAGRLRDFCEQGGHPLHVGPVWSTDAPLRETVGKVCTYGEEGVLAVEMEMSALFRVADYRKVGLAGLLVVSDELFTLKWRPGFRSSAFKGSCRRAVGAVLDFVAGVPPEPGT